MVHAKGNELIITKMATQQLRDRVEYMMHLFGRDQNAADQIRAQALEHDQLAQGLYQDYQNSKNLREQQQQAKEVAKGVETKGESN